MTAKVFPIRPALTALHCSGCGAVADASCDCGLPYVPAIERAAKAIEETPELSNVAIAERIGVSDQTVRRARLNSTSTRVEVDARIGRDGKLRRLPVKIISEEPDGDADEFTPKELAARNRGSFLLRAQEAKNFAFYTGRVDDGLLDFARSVAAAWCELVADMEKRK